MTAVCRENPSAGPDSTCCRRDVGRRRSATSTFWSTTRAPSPAAPLTPLTRKRGARVWELKVFGYINLTRAVYRNMRERGGGVIINNIGNAGQVFDSGYVAGTSGNAGLMAFTRAMGGRSLADGIRVVGINPGPVDTERNLQSAEAPGQGSLRRRVALHRVVEVLSARARPPRHGGRGGRT